MGILRIEHFVDNGLLEGQNKTVYGIDRDKIRLFSCSSDENAISTSTSISLNSKEKDAIRSLFELINYRAEELYLVSKTETSINDSEVTHTVIKYDDLKEFTINDDPEINNKLGDIIDYVRSNHQDDFAKFEREHQLTQTQHPDGFVLDYVSGNYTLTLKYNPGDNYMFCTFGLKHEYVSGNCSFRVSSQFTPYLLRACEPLFTYEKEHEGEASTSFVGDYTFNRFSMTKEYVRGEGHFFVDSEEAAKLFDSLLDKICNIDSHVRDYVNRARNFVYEEDVEPIERLKEKYPSLFNKGDLTKDGYDIITSLLDTYAPELENATPEINQIVINRIKQQ